MSHRGSQLLKTADRQITDLTALLSTAKEATLRRPCPGREKLGDGTVAAVAQHTADTYVRIAEFLTVHSEHSRFGAAGHDDAPGSGKSGTPLAGMHSENLTSAAAFGAFSGRPPLNAVWAAARYVRQYWPGPELPCPPLLVP
jgi:hypothetical protein